MPLTSCSLFAPDLPGAPGAEQIEPPLFFSLADNWIPGYAWPTNDTLTFRVTTVGNITGGDCAHRRIFLLELTYLDRAARML